LFTAILVAFAPTQIPLGILEGLLTAIGYQFLCTHINLNTALPGTGLQGANTLGR
jgi:hypothetical protein